MVGAIAPRKPRKPKPTRVLVREWWEVRDGNDYPFCRMSKTKAAEWRDRWRPQSPLVHVTRYRLVRG